MLTYMKKKIKYACKDACGASFDTPQGATLHWIRKHGSGGYTGGSAGKASGKATARVAPVAPAPLILPLVPGEPANANPWDAYRQMRLKEMLANASIKLRVKRSEWQAMIRLLTYGPGAEPKLAGKLINQVVEQVSLPGVEEVLKKGPGKEEGLGG